MTKRTAKPRVTIGSGNVFDDLRLPSPAEALAKSELAAILAEAIRARRLTQTAAARLLGIDQPKVSELLRGRLSRFSTERLLLFLLRVGRDIDIVVRRPRAASDGAPPGTLHVRTSGARRASGPGGLTASP